MKFLLTLAMMTISLNVSAGLFDNKMRIYKCPSSSDAYSCSNACEKTKIEVTFTIDKQANKVLMNIYSDGKSDRSVMLDSCFVFDSKNFKCGEGFNQTNKILEDRTMKNGKYVSIFQTTPSGLFNDFSCTK